MQRLHEAMRNFHSLAGIGGTYGYHNITAAARDAELECNHVIESGAGVETIEQCFARLYEVASPVCRELPSREG